MITVLYNRESLADKCLVSLHPRFSDVMEEEFVTSTSEPILEDLMAAVRSQYLIVIGDVYADCIDAFTEICESVVWITRKFHTRIGEMFEVEKWFNLWCQLPRSDILTAIYDYEFRFPSLYQRHLYDGVLVTPAMRYAPARFGSWIIEASSKEVLPVIVQNGKNVHLSYTALFEERLNRARVDRANKTGIIHGIDGPVKETLYRLIERFQLEEVIATTFIRAPDRTRSRVFATVLSAPPIHSTRIHDFESGSIVKVTAHEICVFDERDPEEWLESPFSGTPESSPSTSSRGPE